MKHIEWGGKTGRPGVKLTMVSSKSTLKTENVIEKQQNPNNSSRITGSQIVNYRIDPPPTLRVQYAPRSSRREPGRPILMQGVDIGLSVLFEMRWGGLCQLFRHDSTLRLKHPGKGVTEERDLDILAIVLF
jgi:hypothetical protein